MEATEAGLDAQAGQSGWVERRRDAALIAILVFLAAALRVWTITHTEVTARDSIGFIRYALQFEQQPKCFAAITSTPAIRYWCFSYPGLFGTGRERRTAPPCS